MEYLLAATSDAGPLSAVVWFFFVLSVGLYPLGLLFSGCPCCSSINCGTPPNLRCMKDECLTCSPRRGTSKRVTDNIGIGIKTVTSRYGISARIRGTSFPSLSTGESQVVTATHYPGYDPSLGAAGKVSPAQVTPESGGDPEPCVFTATIIGVTIPLPVSAATGDLAFGTTQSGQTRSSAYRFGELYLFRKSVSAPVSVVTRAVAVTSGGSFLDPAVATESALLGMVTWSTPTNVLYPDPFNPFATDAFDTTWTISPPASMFQYLPTGSSVVLSYIIEYRRGSTSVYRTAQATVSKTAGQSVTPMPNGGFQPLSLPTYNLTDTPNTPTPPVVNGRSITVWSNTTTFALTQRYVFEPTGTSLFWQPVFDISGTTSSIFVQTQDTLTTRSVFDPTNASGSALLPNAPYNFNFNDVEAFARSERCLQYTTGGQTYERCLDPRNPLCELALCDRTWLLPQTATLTKQTPCGSVVSLAARLTGGIGKACGYHGTLTYCNFVAATSESNGAPGIPPSAFYDGDLLYAIEKGPSRSSVVLSDGATLTLGGMPTLPQGGMSAFSLCDTFTIAGLAGKCVGSAQIVPSGGSVGAVTQRNNAWWVSSELEQAGLDELIAHVNAAFSPLPSSPVERFRGCDSKQWNASKSGTYRVSYSADVGYDACGTRTSSGTIFGTTDPKEVGTARIQTDVIASSSNLPQMSVTGQVSFFSSGQPVATITYSGSGSMQVTETLTGATIGSAVVTSVVPSSMDWRGGGYTVNARNYNNTTTSFTGTLPARTDAIQANAVIPVIVSSFPGSNFSTPGGSPSAVAYITQTAKPCGIIGLNRTWSAGSNTANSLTAPRAGSVGLLVPLFHMDTPCDQGFTATSAQSWITVEIASDMRSMCVRVDANGTGSSRSGSVQISPAWLLSGVASDSSSATLGALNYAITQSA